jgi:stalled ribosome alternative rescue factor ArfA
MKHYMKSRGGTGATRRAPNASAKALSNPLFRQRIVKSKKVYKRQQNQTLGKIDQNQ